jgi:hypothetical protein
MIDDGEDKGVAGCWRMADDDDDDDNDCSFLLTNNKQTF